MPPESSHKSFTVTHSLTRHVTHKPNKYHPLPQPFTTQTQLVSASNFKLKTTQFPKNGAC